MCEDKNSCITINCGCCGNGNSNDNGNDSTPVGTVISFMGTEAPKHYLICDGTVYNIDDYKEFSQFIKDEHGSFDFFGGDGTTTFAVPDLRGEFLRGTGTGTRDTGTGAEVGVHQDGTRILNTAAYNAGSVYSFLQYYSNSSGALSPLNGDKAYKDAVARIRIDGTNDTTVAGSTGSFTSRPTNTADLYCIKYE